MARLFRPAKLEGVSIEQNLADVNDRIARACERVGRSPDSVTLIAVSKGVEAARLRQTLDAGQRVFGENRVQEAVEKIEALADEAGLRWHLVGHLQTNKAKVAAGRFAMIHSVDSLRLAQELSRRVERQAVLLEVNVTQEATKFGFAPQEVAGALSTIQQLPHLDVKGLMTVAPAIPDQEQVRPVFRELRQIRESLGLAELSMGMTGDFETAIEEGATLVRVGRAIFGERPKG
jgi:pyridoxal phosphate enzyme (YggS family)